jgi:hypothetical protein
MQAPVEAFLFQLWVFRDSSFRSGYVAMASKTRRTVIRIPRMHGWPFI